MSSISKTTTLSLGDAGAGGESSHRSYDTRDKIMLGAVVILFSIILLILALHFFVRWLVVRRAGRRLRRQRHSILSRQCGLDPAILESLPVLLFSASADGQKAGECAVCLDKFEDGQRVRSLPRCGHCFHADCVDAWFSSHSNCPLCRAPAEPVLSASESTSAAEICSSSLRAPGDGESVSEVSAGESNGFGERIQQSGSPLDLKRHIAKEFLTRVFGLNRVGTPTTEPDLEADGYLEV